MVQSLYQYPAGLISAKARLHKKAEEFNTIARANRRAYYGIRDNFNDYMKQPDYHLQRIRGQYVPVPPRMSPYQFSMDTGPGRFHSLGRSHYYPELNEDTLNLQKELQEKDDVINSMREKIRTECVKKDKYKAAKHKNKKLKCKLDQMKQKFNHIHPQNYQFTDPNTNFIKPEDSSSKINIPDNQNSPNEYILPGSYAQATNSSYPVTQDIYMSTSSSGADPEEKLLPSRLFDENLSHQMVMPGMMDPAMSRGMINPTIMPGMMDPAMMAGNCNGIMNPMMLPGTGSGIMNPMMMAGARNQMIDPMMAGSGMMNPMAGVRNQMMNPMMITGARNEMMNPMMMNGTRNGMMDRMMMNGAGNGMMNPMSMSGTRFNPCSSMGNPMMTAGVGSDMGIGAAGIGTSMMNSAVSSAMNGGMINHMTGGMMNPMTRGMMNPMTGGMINPMMDPIMRSGMTAGMQPYSSMYPELGVKKDLLDLEYANAQRDYGHRALHHNHLATDYLPKWKQNYYISDADIINNMNL